MLAGVLRNSKIRFIQCIDDGGRQLSNMVFKTMLKKTLNAELFNEINIKKISLILFVLLKFEIRKLACRTLYYSQLENPIYFIRHSQISFVLGK